MKGLNVNISASGSPLPEPSTMLSVSTGVNTIQRRPQFNGSERTSRKEK
jgi:hypothetical protein